MKKTVQHGVLLSMAVFASGAVCAETSAAPDAQTQLQLFRQQVEQRLQALENAPASAPTKAMTAAPGAARPAGFNPSLALNLSGVYANLSRDPAAYRLQGFFPGGDEVGPGRRGFSLGESELTLSATVDPHFRGVLTFALTDEGEAEVEEAYAETLALGQGLNLRMGRFLSGLGYLNSQHAHAWDFVDAPLAYQAFYGGQFKNDGLQLRWLAPADRFFEVGGELGAGNAFPASAGDRNGSGAAALFVRLGDDWGDSVSWQANAWYQRTRAHERSYVDEDSTGTEVTNAFSGRSSLWGLGGVLKWSPSGNAGERNVKVQGEYLHRREEGTLIRDLNSEPLGQDSGSYQASQSGWYLQAIYQFMPNWRVGVRLDQLNSGDRPAGVASSGDFAGLDPYRPHRTAAMLDWSLSEFSRLRLQYGREHSAPGAVDHQIFLQYNMSLGAHGAHAY